MSKDPPFDKNEYIPLVVERCSRQGREFEAFMKKRVKGQDRAIRYMREFLEIDWAGLRNPMRPVSFFLLGPSAVGKTETVKAFAEYMFGRRDGYTHIDCGATKDSHYVVSELLGAPPGYIGYDKPPLLSQETIDMPALQQECERGVLVDEVIVEQRKQLVHNKKYLKQLEAKLLLLRAQILDCEKQIKNLLTSCDKIKKKIKKLELELKQRKDPKIEKEIEQEEFNLAVAEKNAAFLRQMEAVQRREAEKIEQLLDGAREMCARIEQNISLLKEIKKYSPKKRLEYLPTILAIYNPYSSYDYESKRKSIILFDEIEKAHPDLYDVMLSILDEGKIKLKSEGGRWTRFHNSFIFMTSNLGSEEIKSGNKIGYIDSSQFTRKKAQEEENRIYEICKAKFKEHFNPEFINRVNKLIVFRPLSPDAMREILDLRLEEKNSTLPFVLRLSDEVKDLIVQEAWKDRDGGARLLGNRLQQFIDTDLAKLMLAGKINKGDEVLAVLKNKKIEFLLKKKTKPLF